MATYDLTSVSMPDKLVTGDILNCPYSGRKISITLPPGKYKLECWGAQGGYRSSSTYGGKGGYAVGTLELSNLIDVFLYAGGEGGYSSTNTGGDKAGGFNGGGYRYGYPGGGGASDIRLAIDSLYARVIVAGGGGSDGKSSNAGGAAGVSASGGYGSGGTMGNTTYSGSSVSTTAIQQSKTGLSSSDTTKTYGGFGFGGAGLYKSSGYGGAGGGGWYGGQGTVPDSSVDDDRGGGGGSSYVYTTSTASQYPSGCLLTANCYLLSASTKAGNVSFTDYNGSTVTGHSGDGAIRITVIEIGEGSKIRKEKIRIQQKGDTSTNWNPDYILLNKEIGVETDTGKMKIGNGLHPWSMLPYTTAEKADGFTNPQILEVLLDDQSTALIGGEHSAVSAGTTGILPVWKGGTGADNGADALTNLGAAPYYHTSPYGYENGCGSTTYYGHLKATMMQDISQWGYLDENAYAQMCRNHGIINDFNSSGDLLMHGQLFITFSSATDNIPSTLVADTGITVDDNVYGVLINEGTSPLAYTDVKQTLVLPTQKITYERYASIDWAAGGQIVATQWVNASKSGAPTQKVDFANKGGGRFYYMGRQPKPQSEIVFETPTGETYLGQLSETYGGWHVTFIASSPNITIKRYSKDLTQSNSQTFTISNSFASSSAVLDKKNGRIFVYVYQATNFSFGAVSQYQISDALINSTITNPVFSELTQSNWNSSSTGRSIMDMIAFNKTLYMVTSTGESSSNYSRYYLQLSKITETGASTGVSLSSYYSYDLYTNGTDLYWRVGYETSSDEDWYIYKYANGDLSSRTTLYEDTYSSSYKQDVTFLGEEIDAFWIRERELWSSSTTWLYYYIVHGDGRGRISVKADDEWALTVSSVTSNWIVISVCGAYSAYTPVMGGGSGICLIDINTGEIEFVDSYCGPGGTSPSYIRFDEEQNLFYFGAYDDYEFIYTIV